MATGDTYIKDLPLKKVLEDTDVFLTEDNTGTQQVTFADLTEGVIYKVKNNSGDSDTLNKTYANTKAILSQMEDADGVHKSIKRYGIKINKSEPNPANRITYIYDAVGMTPAKMDFATGKFNYGSWENVPFVKNNYPCMVRYDGVEDYRLNPNNYKQKENGSVSDVVNLDYSGNAMSAFVGGWLCQYETDTHEYIIWCNEQYDDSYHAYHRMDTDGIIRPGFYRRIYSPTLHDKKARSISGQLSMYGKNATIEKEYIKANSDCWEHTAWSEYNYITCLLKIMAKTEDCQVAYGNGNMNGYVADETQHYGILAAGTLDTRGQFYGSNANNQQVKVFHTESMWGDQLERLVGLICDKGRLLVKSYGDYNFTGYGYIEVYNYRKNGIETSTSGFVKSTIQNQYGRFPISFEGSSSTYICDGSTINPNITAVAMAGGFGAYGTRCGCGAIAFDASSGTAHWYCVPGLSCKMPIDV